MDGVKLRNGKMETDTHYTEEPVRRLQRAVAKSKRAEEALAHLLDIYTKKVAVLELLKIRAN